MTDNKQTSLNMEDLCDKIYNYTNYDGHDEYVEYVRSACELSAYSYQMSDELKTALLTELEGLLKYYQENTTIVEKEETQTITIKEVEHH